MAFEPDFAKVGICCGIHHCNCVKHVSHLAKLLNDGSITVHDAAQKTASKEAVFFCGKCWNY